MVLTCAYLSHRRRRRSKIRAGKWDGTMGVLSSLGSEWNTITRQSPRMLGYEFRSFRFKSIQSIVMEDVFWVVMSNDEQWRWGKCYTFDIVTTVKGGLTQGVPTRHCCKFNQHPLKRCYAATRYCYCMYVYNIPTTIHTIYILYRVQ